MYKRQELNLSECAVIAAITQNPTRYNPITNPDENVKRRNIVLEDMFEQGYITQEELRAAETDDVYVLIQEVDAAKSNESSVYSYFVDETIVQALSDLQEKAGYSETEARNLLYSGGLKIYTCLLYTSFSKALLPALRDRCCKGYCKLRVSRSGKEQA